MTDIAEFPPQVPRRLRGPWFCWDCELVFTGADVTKRFGPGQGFEWNLLSRYRNGRPPTCAACPRCSNRCHSLAEARVAAAQMRNRYSPEEAAEFDALYPVP